MKAITLTQPWATLVAVGAKRIETRGWKTNYRGPLAIHAAKGWTKDIVKLAMSEPFRSVLHDAGYSLFSLLPRGMVIATTRLVAIYEITKSSYKDGKALVLAKPMLESDRFIDLAPISPEWFFGNYAPGRCMWFLDDVHAISPIPSKGSLGIWEWKFGDDRVEKSLDVRFAIDGAKINEREMWRGPRPS